MSKILIEVCVDSVESAMIAEQAGADRIELNSALEVGGLTPSIGSLIQIKSRVKIPVICMVRCRPGNFIYSEVEYQTIVADAEKFIQAGADGLAFGFQERDGNINLKRTKNLVSICGECTAVFHRAFDCVPDQDSGLEQLIEAGVARVLTSGGKATASAGATKLRHLIQQASGRIEILPGSGINPTNAKQLVEQTGCNQLHGSFAGLRAEPLEFEHAINFSAATGGNMHETLIADSQKIDAVIKAVQPGS